MHEIVVISGKGGTGKTSLTASFVHLAKNLVVCDLDVDAPDLHILLEPAIGERHEFWSGYEARIRTEDCSSCGVCQDLCRFGAIIQEGEEYYVNPLHCEGCKVCVEFCPAKCIDFVEKHCGNWFVSATRMGSMVHAQLFPGDENSGRLVSLLREKAKDLAEQKRLDLVVCDGSPGIGCPVISSVRGASLAVIVTEPTPSGLHDLERVGQLCDHFRVPVGVVINKANLNSGAAHAIGVLCAEKGYTLLGALDYDHVVVEAMLARQTITEFSQDDFSATIEKIWEKTLLLCQTSKYGKISGLSV